MVKTITTKVLDGRTKSLSRKFNQLSKIITDEMDNMDSFELLTKYYIKPTFWIDCSIKCCITYFTTYLISRLIGNGFKAISETINSNPIPKKDSDNKIIGYGSPAKATTALNFFGISNEIDFIVEDN